MPWVACESADKHAGGKNTNNNIEKTLLQREHFTELQLSAATRDGPGARHPPLPLPRALLPCRHRHCQGAALSWMLGGVFLGLLRRQPLILLLGTAASAGWYRENVGCDGEQSCQVCRLRRCEASSPFHGWQGPNSWVWSCPSGNRSVLVVPGTGAATGRIRRRAGGTAVAGHRGCRKG